jgi:hypothetical protein
MVLLSFRLGRENGCQKKKSSGVAFVALYLWAVGEGGSVYSWQIEEIKEKEDD